MLNVNFYAPRFIGSHYGRDSLAKLRRLDRAVRTRAKRKADIEFLHKCLTYHLTPVFLRFKLCKKKRCREIAMFNPLEELY